MTRVRLSLAIVLLATTHVWAKQIGPNDFTNSVVENFENLGLPFNNIGSLSIHGVTYTTDTGTFRYANWARAPILWGISTESDTGFIDVVFSTPVSSAGGWVAISGGRVEVFNESDQLLGTVFLPRITGQAETPPAFAGWQSTVGLIRRIRFHDDSVNYRVMVLGLVMTEQQ